MPERIVLDRGIDLGTSWRQSLLLLARLEEVAALGLPVLVAVSNKIFLRRALGLDEAPLDVAGATGSPRRSRPAPGRPPGPPCPATRPG